MLFFAPLMLAGLAALSLPVIIHLLDRSKTSTVDWPTLRFLKIAQRESAQRARLKHLLVLLARCALLALVAIAMAKPYARRDNWAQPENLPQTLAIVIDNSYSMGYHDGGAKETRFDRAKALAIDQIGTLGQNDEVAVLLVNDATTLLTDRPTRDHELARKLVQQAKISLRGTQLGPALLQAFEVAGMDAADASKAQGQTAGVTADSPTPKDDDSSKSQIPNPKSQIRRAWRHVLLLTDMQRSGWTSVLDNKLLDKAAHPLPVTAVDLGDPDASNRYIRQARVSEALAGNTFGVDIEVGTCGNAPAATGAADQAQLWIDGQRATGSGATEIIPQGGGKLTLHAELPGPGLHTCMVALDEDHLPIDDRAYLAMNITGGNRVTVVDGQPSDVPALSGTYFLNAALATSAGRPGAPAVDHMTPQELSTAHLAPGSCVVLVNVPRLDGSALTGVENLLRSGGSVWVCLGDHADPVQYNSDWHFLPIRLDRLMGDPGRSRSYSLSPQVADHPIFAGGLDLAATRYFTFMGTDPTTLQPGARVLASFSNGSPAIVEGTFGGEEKTRGSAHTPGQSPGQSPGPAPDSPAGSSGGKVLVFAGGIDGLSTNLTHRRVFVPLVDRVVSYLTRRRLTSRGLTVGQPIRFTGPGTLQGQPLVITAPDGTRQSLTAALEPDSGNVSAEYHDTWQVGVYHVQADEGFATGGAFVVNLDTRESILTPATTDEVTKAFGNHPFRVVHSRPTDMASWRPGHEKLNETRDVQYWPWLLLAAMIVFGTETVLANFFTRRKRAVPPPEIEYLGARRPQASLAGAGARS